MRRIGWLLVMAMALPAEAVVVLKERPPAGDADEVPKLNAPEFRANQINRCTDARGRTVLQDAPCFAAPAASSGEVADVPDLASLEPRPGREPLEKAGAETPSAWLGWLRGAWWKLVAVGLCAWAIARVWQIVRANWLFRQYAEDRPERTVRRR